MMKTKPYYQYADDVIAGKIKTGEAIVLACKRFKEDLKRTDLVFKEKKVDKVIRFVSLLKHFRGKAAGKPFVLEPWQTFCIANIYGFYWKSTNVRRFRYSYIEISRKNGKTAFASALATYAMFDVASAQVMLCANSREQAKIAYDFCERFAKQLSGGTGELKVYRDRIKSKSGAMMLVCSSDSDKLDGWNPTFCVLDEYHAAKDTKVRDVIKSGMTIPGSHLMTITTAGFDKTGPCYQYRTVCQQILHGIQTDDSTFAAIWSLDDDDDWQNPDNWVKCAPNMNITVDMDYYKDQVHTAIINPSEEVGVRTKTLNQWVDSFETWIPDSYILNCTQKINVDDFIGSYCFMGVDLGAVSDMTATAYLFKRDDAEDDKLYVKIYYYLPESALTENSNKEMYKLWKMQKYLIITPGNITDYDYILNDMCEMRRKVNIYKVGYDSWSALAWANSATALGFPLVPFSQTIGNFNKPTCEIERLIRCNKIIFDDNPITLWMFSNVALKRDWNGNQKPNKGLGNQKKIDGVIAAIEALGKYLETPIYTASETVVL